MTRHGQNTLRALHGESNPTMTMTGELLGRNTGTHNVTALPALPAAIHKERY